MQIIVNQVELLEQKLSALMWKKRTSKASFITV